MEKQDKNNLPSGFFFSPFKCVLHVIYLKTGTNQDLNKLIEVPVWKGKGWFWKTDRYEQGCLFLENQQITHKKFQI